MSWVVPIPERGRAAWNAFQAALEAASRVPCAARLEWISESADDRSYAAGHCRDCPILAECGAAATAIGMKVGVLGRPRQNTRKGTTYRALHSNVRCNRMRVGQRANATRECIQCDMIAV